MRVTHLFALLFVAATAAAVADEPKAEVKNPDLRDELQKRGKTDQEARGRLIEWMKANGGDTTNLPAEKKAEFAKLSDEMAKVDANNTKWLGGVVDKDGWPMVSQVGKEAAGTAWLLVQHADADPKFQRKCLDLMTKLPKGEADAKNVAYLTDRVLLAEGKKQVYGTQFHSPNGKLEPRPLEDEANVDKRRAEVGLSSLAEYKKQLEAVYGPAKK